MKRKSLVLLVMGGVILASMALLSSCPTSPTPEPQITHYAGSDPKGDYIEIQINHDEAKVRRINHTTSEDSGWLSYTPETAMASGFTILNRVVTDATHFVLFAEFAQEACIYQAFDNTMPPPVTEGNPVYVVYRERVATSTYYDKAYNWMEFKINDLGDSDMNTGFAAFDLSGITKGMLYGAGYSHRRQLRSEGTEGVEDINTGEFLMVDAITYDSSLVANIMWEGGNVGNMDYALVMAGTASGTHIIDHGSSAGGGMNFVLPQTASAAFNSNAFAGTYFTMHYALNGQTNESLTEPLKIVITSGGNVQAYDYDGPITDPALFDEALVDVSSYTGGPVSGDPISETYQTVSGNASAASSVVQQAHLCYGAFIAEDSADSEIVVVMFDPSGSYLAFTMFKPLAADDGDFTNDFEIRFGMGIKDAGYADP
jgi:hypothetical protein